MTQADPVVVVIDDDEGMREALQSLLRSVGIEPRSFGSVQDFLAAPRPTGPHCLVLDVRLPGQSGLDLQADLAKGGLAPPIIFITGHGDIPMSVRAMRAGAVEFLTKPFRDQDLLDAIQVAIDRDRLQREGDVEMAALLTRFDALTPREREVLSFVASGLLNKQIANAIGVTEITVKVHRGQVMKKLAARSIVDLVRMVDKINASRPPVAPAARV